jgi:MFS family permease
LGATFLFNLTGYAAIGAALQILLPAQVAAADKAGAARTMQTTASTVCLVVGMLVVGPLADRLDRRKLSSSSSHRCWSACRSRCR